MSQRHGARVEAADEEAGATTIELFFDLVFVFALTQVTAMMAGDLSGSGLLHGMLITAIVGFLLMADRELSPGSDLGAVTPSSRRSSVGACPNSIPKRSGIPGPTTS
jgi:low temperature requirement A protein (LtrA)